MNVTDQPTSQSLSAVNTASSNELAARSGVAPQLCPGCAAHTDAGASAPPINVYALGRVEARFPRLAVEKEFAQVVGKVDTAGLTDRQVMHDVLGKREHRYLARKMCWLFEVEGIPTYLLQPRDPADFDLLVSSVRAAPAPTDIDLVVGVRGPVAPPEACNGLMVPMVLFDQLYSFDLNGLVTAIPRPDGISIEKFRPVAEEVFARLMQVVDNAGASDDHRALNYLAVRYPAIYALAAELHGRSFALSAVDVRPSSLGGVRSILNVIFTYTHRATDVVEKYRVRVDVTEEFPFLASKLTPYVDR
jgi:hypothetical protein